MTPKPSTCHDCAFRNEGYGYAGPTGPEDSPFIIIGQGPGAQEVHYGTAFYPHAPAGSKLGDWLNAAGISRKACYVDNVVRCRFVKRDSSGRPKVSPRTRDYMDREPTPKEIESCLKRHLIPQLTRILALPRETNRLLVIPVGKPAAVALINPRPYNGSLTLMRTSRLWERLHTASSGLSSTCETQARELTKPYASPVTQEQTSTRSTSQ
jgi:uracil-DNA glycosylase family 4